MLVRKSIYTTLLHALICILPVNSLSAQSLDSLKNALSTEQPIEKRIALLTALGEAQLVEKPREAIAYFNELLTIARHQNNKLLTSYCLNRIGNCWYYLNDLKQSTQFYFQALEATEDKPEYHDLKSKIYNNLGWAFKKFEDFEKALDYFRLAEANARKSGDKQVLGLILNNKGVTQKDMKQYHEALASLHESAALNHEARNKRHERFNLNNIAVVYLEMNQVSEAIEKLRQVLELNEELQDTTELINNLENLGNAYLKMGDYQEAERAFFLGLNYAEQKKSAERKQNLLSEISKLYRVQGKHAEALDYYNKFYLISDSLKAQETKRYALELESKYNSLMKERELETARKELAEQKLYLTWFVGALLLAIMVVIFFWRAYLLKRRNERKLLDMNREIETQSVKLRQVNEEILVMNENLEKLVAERTEVIQSQNNRLRHFAFMNAHKIRGPVASIIGLVNLLTDERNQEHSKILIEHLSTSANNLDEIIHDVNRQLEEDNQVTSTEVHKNEHHFDENI